MTSAVQQRLWRVAGVLLIAHVVLVFAGVAFESQLGLGDPSQSAIDALVNSSLAQNLAGGYVEYVGFLVLLPGGILVARLLRGDTETSTWLASCAAGSLVAYVAVTVATGFAAGAAALYDGHHGAPLATVVAVNDVRGFAFFLSGGLAGLVALGLAGAVQLTAALPRWVAYSGYVVGVLSIAAIPGAGLGLQNVSTLLWLAWTVALGVAALRHGRAGAEVPARRVSMPA
jgi:hypothetical protein